MYFWKLSKREESFKELGNDIALNYHSQKSLFKISSIFLLRSEIFPKQLVTSVSVIIVIFNDKHLSLRNYRYIQR